MVRSCDAMSHRQHLTECDAFGLRGLFMCVSACVCVSFQSCASELRTASQVDALKIFIRYLFSRSLLSFYVTPKDRQTNTLNLHINFVYAAEFVSIFMETVIRG